MKAIKVFQHPTDIVICMADNGDKIVVLDKSTYKDMVMTTLNDITTYRPFE